MQEWGNHGWGVADASPITAADVAVASPHRSGDIAVALGLKVTSIAPTRDSLIAKGMQYSPAHGDTAFAVSLFDAFMRGVTPA